MGDEPFGESVFGEAGGILYHNPMTMKNQWYAANEPLSIAVWIWTSDCILADRCPSQRLVPFNGGDDVRVHRLHDAGIAVSRGVQHVRLVEVGLAGHPVEEKRE
jgi:hypothetical protein